MKTEDKDQPMQQRGGDQAGTLAAEEVKVPDEADELSDEFLERISGGTPGWVSPNKPRIP